MTNDDKEIVYLRDKVTYLEDKIAKDLYFGFCAVEDKAVDLITLKGAKYALSLALKNKGED